MDPAEASTPADSSKLPQVEENAPAAASTAAATDDWDDDDWQEWQVQADAQRVALEGELEQAKKLLERARTQVVSLQMGQFGKLARASQRLPGARRCEVNTQTDPMHDEAVKRDLHEQIHAREVALADMTKKLEAANTRLGQLKTPNKPNATDVAMAHFANFGKRKAAAGESSSKGSYMLKGPQEPRMKSTEKATMTDDLVTDDPEVLKAEIAQLKLLTANSISAEEHAREVDYLKEKFSLEQRRMDARVACVCGSTRT